jgi:glycosyltransferase involved in cell wall biosynthesis
VKICYLCADSGIPVGGRKGASAHVRGLVRALASLGNDVRVLAARAEGEADVGAPVSSIPPLGLVNELPPSPSPRLRRALGHLFANAATERALAELLAEWQPDVVYERYSPFGVAGAVVARRCGVPHVLEVNSPLAWEGKEYRGQALTDAAEWLEEVAFASTLCIVAVSRELRDILASSGVDAAKIAVVPNGVDVDFFSPDGEVCRDGLEGKVTVGFVGNLRPWHGVEMLADAFREVARDPSFHLLVVGDGPLSKRVAELAEELPGRVTHLGAVPHTEVPKLLRAMDIAVAPYLPLDRFYYSPLKVLEYMASGRPIVASRIGQIGELLRHGETAVLVEPGDAAALAAAIRDLGSSPQRRRALGEAAAAEARLEHQWQHRAASILKHLRELRS